MDVLRGQDVVNEGFELGFAEGAAAAFVDKDVLDVLQAAGKLVDAFLRFVDGGEAGDDVAKGVLAVVNPVLQAVFGMLAKAGDGLVEFLAQEGVLLLLDEVVVLLLLLQIVAQFAELVVLVGGKFFELPRVAALLPAQDEDEQQAGQDGGDDEPVGGAECSQVGVYGIHDAVLCRPCDIFPLFLLCGRHRASVC